MTRREWVERGARLAIAGAFRDASSPTTLPDGIKKFRISRRQVRRRLISVRENQAAVRRGFQTRFRRHAKRYATWKRRFQRFEIAAAPCRVRA